MAEESDRAENGDAVRDTGSQAAAPQHPPPAARVLGAALIAFFIILVIAAMLAGLGVLADGLAEPVLTLFRWWVGTMAVLHTIGILVRARTPPKDRKPRRWNDLSFPRALSVYRYLLRATPVALVVGGHYQLAALLFYLICLGIAQRVEDRRILGELKHVDPVSRVIHAVIFTTAAGVARLLAPVVRPVFGSMTDRIGDGTPLVAFILALPFLLLLMLIALPFWLVYALFLIPCMAVKGIVDWFRTRRGDRAMIECLREGGTLAYFVYAEPHQREHFLGENGVLKPLEDRILARDWRIDLEPVRVSAYAGKGEGADAMFLRRFRLTKLKDDLPFVAVLAAGGKVHPFYCSGPYRQRRRDGGVALIRVEDDIRSVLAKHVAALPAAE